MKTTTRCYNGPAYLRARDGAAAVAAPALEKRSRGDDGRRRRRTAAGSEGVEGRRARREGGAVEEEKKREGERRHVAANASIALLCWAVASPTREEYTIDASMRVAMLLEIGLSRAR